MYRTTLLNLSRCLAMATIATASLPEVASATDTIAAPFKPYRRSTTFNASITGTSDQGVTWSVTEGTTGGSITTQGVYTAPGSAGT